MSPHHIRNRPDPIVLAILEPIAFAFNKVPEWISSIFLDLSYVMVLGYFTALTNKVSSRL